MGGKEKVLRLARGTQSGQEANKNFCLTNPTRSIAAELCFDVLLRNPGKDITPWLTLKSKKSS